MTSRETGKDRAARIAYNYLLGPDRLIRWRLGLTVAALLATTVMVAWSLLAGESGRLPVSHGPLARAHATWDTRCEACHVPLRSPNLLIRGQALGVASEAGDRKCQACHMGGDDQTHHLTQNRDLVKHCADCHRDHQGREASLTRLAEAECTSCHRDLDRGLWGILGLNDIAKSIVHFHDGSHPNFRSAAADPGRIKFNHATHMAAGLASRPDGRPLLTYAQLPQADRARFGGDEAQKPTDPVRLDCQSCHRLDRGDSPFQFSRDRSRTPDAVEQQWASLPPRAAGGTILPIRYELHCAACHPLDLPGRIARLGDTGGPSLPIRHRLQPAELHRELLATSLALVLDRPRAGAGAGAGAETPPVQPRFLQDSPDLPTVRKDFERHVSAAESILFGRGKGTCTECHYYDSPDGEPTRSPDGRIDPARFRVDRAGIPDVWLVHARFDHSAHRAMNCRECHPRAYPDADSPSGRPSEVVSPSGAKRWALNNGKETWTAHEDVLLPGIQTCQRCHAPRAADTAGNVSGGAGFDCTECHTYHNGDRPQQGPGALARGIPIEKQKLLEQFLRGDPSSRPAPSPRRP